MLIWNPVHQAIAERVAAGDPLILAAAPFAKIDALAELLATQGSVRGLKVIVRWRPLDLANGVSDLEVYGWLKRAGANLYINSNIHLKLYVFESNQAICTSANLTRAGLGYAEAGNIEAGCMARVTDSDWHRLNRLIDESRLVDDEVFDRFRIYLKTLPVIAPPAMPPFELPPRKQFTIAGLPATDSPVSLLGYYKNPGAPNIAPEFVRRAGHDLALFGIQAGLSDKDFMSLVSARFRALPFVVAFLDHLRAVRSLRFGAVNEWIHAHCEDVPLPYRWELKIYTHVLFDWLKQLCVPNVTWSIPGRHSQVIEWRDE